MVWKDTIFQTLPQKCTRRMPGMARRCRQNARNRKRKRKNCGGGCGPDASPWPCVDGRPRDWASSKPQYRAHPRRREAAWRRRSSSNARLREAIDILPQGIVFLDAEGRYILWNEKYARSMKRAPTSSSPARGWRMRCGSASRAATIRMRPAARGMDRRTLGKLHHPGLRHEQMLSDGRCILIEDRLTGRRRRDRAARRHHRAEAARSCSACCSTATRCR